MSTRRLLSFLCMALMAVVLSFGTMVSKANDEMEFSDPTYIDFSMVHDIPAPEEEEIVQEDPEPQAIEEEQPAPIIQAEPEEARPSSKLTKASGVNYYGGRKETWYSSRVLHHYMTDQWTAGEDGVYRDSDGYVVVACSDIPYGSVIDTSFGAAKVYDCGCDDGITDVYVNW